MKALAWAAKASETRRTRRAAAAIEMDFLSIAANPNRRGSGCLGAEAVAAAEEPQVEEEEGGGRRGQRKEGGGDADFAEADKAVADQVDHVEDRVEAGQGLERLRQQGGGVEDAAEEDQRLQDE